MFQFHVDTLFLSQLKDFLVICAVVHRTFAGQSCCLIHFLPSRYDLSIEKLSFSAIVSILICCLSLNDTTLQVAKIYPPQLSSPF